MYIGDFAGYAFNLRISAITDNGGDYVQISQLQIRGIEGSSGGGGDSNNSPVVSISSPVIGSTFDDSDTITFTATATDDEDGDIASSITWTSDIDGSIGSGGSFDTSLSLGTHIITATVSDSEGASDSDSVAIIIENTSETVTTTTGQITLGTSNGVFSSVDTVDESTLPTDGFPTVTFVDGLISMTISGLSNGDTTAITFEMPDDMSTDTEAWKVVNDEWIDFTSSLGSNDGDNILTLTVTDGGTGDSDGVANGIIVDPVGFGSPYEIDSPQFVDSFSIALQDTYPRGIDFSDDGLQLFVLGNVNNLVLSYDLTDSFDISTATYDNSFYVGDQDTNLIDIEFSSDGTLMFVVGHDNDYVSSYDLSVPYDVSTAAYADNFSIASQDIAPRGLAFSADGTQMFMVGNVSDDVFAYDLSSSWNIVNATFVDNYSTSAQAPTGLAFSVDGMNMFVLDNRWDKVRAYDLTTSFDISTATYVDYFYVDDQDGGIRGLAFSTDGEKMFIAGNHNDNIYEYNLPSAYSFE